MSQAPNKVTPNPPAPAGEPGKANGTKTLTVGCKLPNGLICEMGKYGDEDYVQVRLNGSNSSNVAGGYGLTPNVSEAFWNAWREKNKHLSFVRKGLVFAHGDLASAKDHAEEFAGAKTGLEALDPLTKLTDPKTGRVVLEVDADHFAQAKRDVARATQAAAR